MNLSVDRAYEEMWPLLAYNTDREEDENQLANFKSNPPHFLTVSAKGNS